MKNGKISKTCKKRFSVDTCGFVPTMWPMLVFFRERLALQLDVGAKVRITQRIEIFARSISIHSW